MGEPGILARIRCAIARGERCHSSQGRRGELPRVAECDSRRAADDSLRNVHPSRRRSGPIVRRRIASEGERRRSCAALVRLDGRIREDLVPILESAARRRRRRALLQPAPLRSSARLAESRPPENDHRGRYCRLRHRFVRGPRVGGRASTARRAVARHGDRGAGPRGARRRGRICRSLVGGRRTATGRTRATGAGARWRRSAAWWRPFRTRPDCFAWINSWRRWRARRCG